MSIVALMYCPKMTSESFEVTVKPMFVDFLIALVSVSAKACSSGDAGAEKYLACM